MLEKRAVFYFSCIPYDFLFQRPQQLYRQWQSNFGESYEFFYVNPPRHPAYVMELLRQRLKHALREKLLHKESNYDTHLLTPWLHTPYFPSRLWGTPPEIFQSPLLADLFRLFLRTLINKNCKNNKKKVAIIASPFWEPLISNKTFDLICYDYLDALVLSPEASYRAARKKQEKLIAKSELIVVTAEALREDTLSVAKEKDVILVSNGVDAQFFEENKSSYTELGFHKKNKKTVGYIGSLYGWLDVDLVYEAAKQLPLIDFVFVGPSYEPDKLNRDAQPSNVYLLGPKEYRQVPACTNMLDIGLIPFKPGPISEASDPVKLYEYFSLGKPVVATDLRPLRRFNDGRLLKIARTPDELVEAINFFLIHDSDAWQASRKRVALQNSWLSKASSIISSIETHIS